MKHPTVLLATVQRIRETLWSRICLLSRISVLKHYSTNKVTTSARSSAQLKLQATTCVQSIFNFCISAFMHSHTVLQCHATRHLLKWWSSVLTKIDCAERRQNINHSCICVFCVILGSQCCLSGGTFLRMLDLNAYKFMFAESESCCTVPTCTVPTVNPLPHGDANRHTIFKRKN